MGKGVSRRGAKAQRTKRKQSSYLIRISVSQRLRFLESEGLHRSPQIGLCARLYIFSRLQGEFCGFPRVGACLEPVVAFQNRPRGVEHSFRVGDHPCRTVPTCSPDGQRPRAATSAVRPFYDYVDGPGKVSWGARTGRWRRRQGSDPSPVSPRLVKAPASSHPLPSEREMVLRAHARPTISPTFSEGSPISGPRWGPSDP